MNPFMLQPRDAHPCADRAKNCIHAVVRRYDDKIVCHPERSRGISWRLLHSLRSVGMTAKKINRDKLATYLVRLYKRAEILRRLQNKKHMDVFFSASAQGCASRG